MAVLLRKSCNEIHRYLLKRESALFGGDAIKWYFLFVGQNLILLADRAAFYVVRDPLSHSSPGQDLCGFSNCFVSSGVSCGGVIVEEVHDISFRRVWNLYC